MSNCLWPHGLQHTRPPCPSLSPGVCSNTCLLGQWFYLTMSFPAAPFSSCLQSLPALESFPVSQLFESSGQIIGASALASVLPMNIQGWYPLGLTGLISLQYKSLKSLLHHGLKAWILRCSALFMVQLSHPYMTTGNAEARLHRASEWYNQDENSGSRFQFNSHVLCLFVLNSSYSLIFFLTAYSASVKGGLREQKWQ